MKPTVEQVSGPTHYNVRYAKRTTSPTNCTRGTRSLCDFLVVNSNQLDALCRIEVNYRLQVSLSSVEFLLTCL